MSILLKVHIGKIRAILRLSVGRSRPPKLWTKNFTVSHGRHHSHQQRNKKKQQRSTTKQARGQTACRRSVEIISCRGSGSLFVQELFSAFAGEKTAEERLQEALEEVQDSS